MGMLFQPDRVALQSKAGNKKYEWPDSYFKEMDPAKRKAMLDKRSKEEDEQLLEQLKKLFAIRYKKDEKGKYADSFLRYWLELRVAAENLDGLFAERRNRRTVKAALKNLCLDESSDFPPELMYQEMCQLTASYIVTCSRDINYTAMLWGLGMKNDAKIQEKINLDLERIGEAIPKYLHMEEEFRVLKPAILDTKKDYLDLDGE